MPRNFKQYTNPFLRVKEPLEAQGYSAIPNLHNAIALHQQGQIGQAEAIYLQLLQIDPSNSGAIHLLGVVAHQSGKYQMAVDLIRQAIEINPNIASYYSNLGNALQELKQFDAAVVSYEKAISLKQDYAEAYLNLGVLQQKLKQLDAAVVSYEKAIALKPYYAEAYYNLGNALSELKKLAAAGVNYEKAISIKPGYAEAYLNLGVLQQKLKQLDAAVVSYEIAIALKPDYAEAYYNLGNALSELKKLDAAVVSYEKAISFKPDYAEVYSNLGNALQELRQLDAAVASYEKAILLNPDFADVYSNLGNALQELRQLDAAVASYEKAILLNPDFAEVYSNQGIALQELKQFDAAVVRFDKAIALKPDYAEAYLNLGVLQQKLKQLDAAVVSYEKAIALKPDYGYLLGMRQHARMHTCDWKDFGINVLELSRKIQNNIKASTCLPVLALPISLSDKRKVAELWSDDKYPYNSSLGPISKTPSKSKIRIGYYSADFHTHPVSILSVGLFEHHDKSKFELIAFSMSTEAHDEMRERIAKSFDQFIDVSSLSDKEVAILSRKLGVDIAVDLGGHTQNGRTGIFSFRAAPIQLSYIGFLGTMGAKYYDYLIADKTIIPVKSQVYYSEKIVYLPSYQVNDSKQEIPSIALSRQALNLPSSGFVYCCFNANYKITPSTFDGWMRILKSVPESVLLLYAENQSAAENLKMEAEKRGVNPARLIFGEKLIRSQYLARFRSADLFLDTLPYNAGATASDALWAGLPVLTCMGESFASRVAASLLFAIGLPELVAETTNEYEELAIELATNPAKLKAIKDKLASNRLTTPLFNTALFTKHIEVAYTEMYERHQADLLPDHIYIKDLDTLS